MRQQVFDGFAVDLDELEADILALQQVLRQHAHARPDLQHVGRWFTNLQRRHNRAGDALVGKKMLTKGFFGTNFHIPAAKIVEKAQKTEK